MMVHSLHGPIWFYEADKDDIHSVIKDVFPLERPRIENMLNASS